MEHLDHELAKLRTGKASTSLITDLMVEYYGAPTPIAQIANVQVSDRSNNPDFNPGNATC